MVNETINGISIALDAAFEGAEIYTKDVEQGLAPGSFSIQVLQPSVQPLLGRRSIKFNPFDILYFPKVEGDHEELYTVGDKLVDVLVFITLENGDMLHGTGIRYEIQDDVLHFFVSYNHTRYARFDETAMETLETNASTKKG